jgi:hypothetical protein
MTPAAGRSPGLPKDVGGVTASPRATKQTDRETEKVQADLRKEYVDVDGDVDRRP